MHLRKSFGSAVLSCALLLTLPTMGQAPQDKGNRSGQPNGGGKPGGNNGNRPTPGGGNRPGPGGNNGGNKPGQGAGRPQPARPNPQPARPQPSRPQPSRPNRPTTRPGRPAQWGRPPQNRPSYNFRSADRNSLQRYYATRMRSINRSRRPVFRMGGFFPYGDIQYLSPIPVSLYGTLPPPPPGYQMGYYDGYVVVYDPVTYFIANVIDLLQ